MSCGILCASISPKSEIYACEMFIGNRQVSERKKIKKNGAQFLYTFKVSVYQANWIEFQTMPTPYEKLRVNVFICGAVTS